MARARAFYRRSFAPAVRSWRPSGTGRCRPRRRSTRAASRRLVRLLLAPEEERPPEGAARREGPPRVPADLLGPARPRPGHPGQRVGRRLGAGRRPGRRALRDAGRAGLGDGLRPGLPPARTTRGRSLAGTWWPTALTPTGRAPRRPRGDDVPQLEGRRAAAGDLDLPDRPGAAIQFPGGELRIAFDAECRFAEGGLVLARPASRGGLGSSGPSSATGSGPTATSCPSAAAAAGGGAAAPCDLLASPRTDFPLAAETKLVMRGPKGEAFVAGLVRLSPAARGAAGAAAAVARRARPPTRADRPW